MIKLLQTTKRSDFDQLKPIKQLPVHIEPSNAPVQIQLTDCELWISKREEEEEKKKTFA